MVTWASPEAKASHELYSKNYNKWLKQHYPDQYGNWVNKTPIRRGVKKWGGKIGTLALLYEGLKEVFDTGNALTDVEEREFNRAGVIKQYETDMTPEIIYNEKGLATGFKAPKGSDVDMSRYMPYQAMKAEPTVPMIPEHDEPQLEWIDPMNEWWPAEKNVYDEREGPTLLTASGRAVKSMYEDVKYVTPPEIRKTAKDVVSLALAAPKAVWKYGLKPVLQPVGDEENR
jgi:hypothetical protein